MIATIFVIIGLISCLFGIWLIYRTLISSFKKEMRELDGEQLVDESKIAKESLHKKRIKHGKIGASALFIGIVSILIGWYIGYAARGNEFWLYKFLFPIKDKPAVSDKLDDQGRYIDHDGLSHAYYIMIKGNEYYFCGTKVENLDAMKEKLKTISGENTVIIIDSYAVDSSVKQIIDLLETGVGLKYEIEQE